MLIDCPSCGKSYHIVKTVLGPAGRRAVCPCCDAIWFIAPDGEGAETRGPDYAAIDSAEISIGAADRAAHRSEPVGLPNPSAASPASKFSFVPTAPEPRLSRALMEFCAGLALVLSIMAIIGFRSEIVQLWPRAATAYAVLGLPVNLRGLALEHFHTVATNDGFQTVLGIEGEIENLCPQTTKIPPIALAIRDERGRVIYSWQVAAPKQSLGANETFAFRARLAAPPQAGRNVLVRFAPTASWSLASAWQKAARHF
ncbi:MAG: MJ0042-type zinc finger domain-containing protein [Methylovirgula sp.]